MDKKQREFTTRLTPWAWFIQGQTALKAREFRGIEEAVGLQSVAFILYVLYQSNWGEHPVSRETFKAKDANNLTLLPANEWWNGRAAKYEGVEYKLFDSWEEFCVHFSDYVVFSNDLAPLLSNPDIYTQLKVLTREDSRAYNESIRLLPLLGITDGKK